MIAFGMLVAVLSKKEK
ncbi:hypothetical protein KY998_23355 [Bacillus paralicheniformis]|nr:MULTISPECIES: hypothetical protein [Bacillus]MCF7619303.1 hypothetical protein [Bacillus sonorensis]MCY8144388.1 hypothetical protein [Bacillus haynesii]MCY7855666.1 hypothetical protein [Bacillus sonorensis]MCY8032541.1 hypothetical protein [Bacillus sonorensis]MCY8087225.1 hypothetical protein [Bacillus sonorensis]